VAPSPSGSYLIPGSNICYAHFSELQPTIPLPNHITTLAREKIEFLEYIIK